MNTYKTIRLRQYTIDAIDRRTGEPLTDTVVFERGASLLLDEYGTDLTDRINVMYSRRGYQVKNITKGSCCTRRVELGSLFASDAE